MDSKELMQENAKVDWMNLVKRHKKKQKGLPALSTLKTNVGPAEPGMSMFNNSVNFDAINGDCSTGSTASDGAGMGESVDTKCIDMSKKYLKEDEATTENNEFDALVSELDKVTNYSTFVSMLQKLNPEQKKMFMQYFGKNTEAIKPNLSKVDIPATNLFPTQSEIDWVKSLSRPLSEDCSKFFSGSVELGMPVLTYKNKYIIDGHHRWSQIYMINPDAKCVCYNFDYQQDKPVDVLRDFQAAVLATTGDVAVGTAGTNIYTINEEKLKEYIQQNIKDACWQSIVKAGKATTKDEVVDYIVKNAMQLHDNNRPASGAPDRVDMPQTTPDVIKRAAAGITDMSESLSAKDKLMKAFPGEFDFDLTEEIYDDSMEESSKFVNRKDFDADDDFDMILRSYPTID